MNLKIKNKITLRGLVGFSLLLAFLCCTAVSAQTKQRADTLYSKEHYAEAAKAYEAILAKQGVAAEIYYNLGNCYYKLDNIPLAILNYERALILSPGDGDIRSNLAFARGKTIDKVTPPSEMFFITWWRDFTHLQSLSAWGMTGIVCFVLALLCLLVYFLAFNIKFRKTGFYLGLFLFFLVILTNLAAYSQYTEMANHAAAIVMDPAVSVKSSHSENSTDLFLIHEGSKVEILDNTMQNWLEVKFEEGKQGWIPAHAVEII